MRQNVDFSVADARIQNPQMQAADVFRRISVAHGLAGGLQLQADDNARRTSTSYCALTGIECANAGGLYAASGFLSAPTPMFAGRAAGSMPPQALGMPTGAVMQAATATPFSTQAYEAYWRGGARLNIDSVSESRCVIPVGNTGSYGYGSASAGCGSYAAGKLPSVQIANTDMGCYTACRSNAGQAYAGQACATLCALQPPGPGSAEDVGPFSIAAPSSGPRFDSDLPLSVGLDACLRQCTDAPLPGQQQACRLGCVAQTGAPALFNNASGPCTLACVRSCTAMGGTAASCGKQCLNACTGTTRQNAYATPATTIPVGL